MIETLNLSRSQTCHNCRNKKLKCDEQRLIYSLYLTFESDCQYISEVIFTKRNFENIASMIAHIKNSLTHEI